MTTQMTTEEFSKQLNELSHAFEWDVLSADSLSKIGQFFHAIEWNTENTAKFAAVTESFLAQFDDSHFLEIYKVIVKRFESIKLAGAINGTCGPRCARILSRKHKVQSPNQP